MRTMLTLLILGITAVVSTACGPEPDQPSSGAPQKQPALPQAGKPVVSPGKPTAPISIEYEIVSKPIVGAPVQINVIVSSAQGPLSVKYSINDASALRFQEGQVQEEEITAAASGSAPRQLSVVPLREGRHFVNVSAEVQTTGGSMIRSMAIPLRVGAAPDGPGLNSAMKESPDGDSVISMPADERPN